jgi:Rps23 Pro-64 3,4-dihydroxylase Tpa1-like proline 4-hydroxylase
MNIINQFLEDEVMKEIIKKYKDSRGEAVFEINEMARWPSSLYEGNFGPVYVLRLDEFKDYFTKKFSTVDPIFQDYKLGPCFMHIWQKGSGIRWHHDGSDEFPKRIGATIYLNERWDSGWGGLFIYENKYGHCGWYCPQYNSCVWFESPMWHHVSIINSNVPFPRLSIQLFFDRI